MKPKLLDFSCYLLQKQPPELFCKKRCSYFAKFTGKHLCQSCKPQVFSCEFCEIFKNTFFTDHLRTIASAISYLLINFHVCPTFKSHLVFFDWRIIRTFLFSEALVRRWSVKKAFLKISENSQENTGAIVSFLIKLLLYFYVYLWQLATKFYFLWHLLLFPDHSYIILSRLTDVIHDVIKVL